MLQKDVSSNEPEQAQNAPSIVCSGTTILQASNKTDKRYKTAAEKAQTKAKRERRRSDKKRRAEWSAAAIMANANNTPLNHAVTTTWSALTYAEDAATNRLSALSENGKIRRLWSAMKRVADRQGVPWIAARAPEYDRKRGAHLHSVQFLPCYRCRTA